MTYIEAPRDLCCAKTNMLLTLSALRRRPPRLVRLEARRYRARPDHAPTDAEWRHTALDRAIERARHFGDEVGEISLDSGRRRRRGIVGEPDHDRTFSADVID